MAKPASQATSMTDVARRADVSLQTVSNVLNRPERVRPATRKRVLDAIRALDYTPNVAARRLRSARASTIAVRLDSNTVDGAPGRGLYAGFIQDEFVYQLTAAAEQRGIKVIAYTAGGPDEEIRRLSELLKSRDADGVVLTSTTEGDRRPDILQSLEVPFISFGRPWGATDLYSTAHPWVDVDGASGTALATRLFWNRGHRDIGFIGWPFRQHRGRAPESVNEDRFQGWQDTMRSLRRDLPVRALSTRAAFSEESLDGGRGAARALLANHPEITAIVCASDTLALGASLEAVRLRRRDVQVSGFDNSPAAAEFGFSSLDQGLPSVADRALQVLMGDSGNQIRHVDFAAASTSSHVLMQAVLIER